MRPQDRVEELTRQISVLEGKRGDFPPAMLQALIEKYRGELQKLQALVDGSQARKRMRQEGRKNAERYARKFAEILQKNGIRKARAWGKPGTGWRVYFPGDAGFLSIGQDGSVADLHRGRYTFSESTLWPAWRKALKTSQREYASWVDAELDKFYGE